MRARRLSTPCCARDAASAPAHVPRRHRSARRPSSRPASICRRRRSGLCAASSKRRWREWARCRAPARRTSSCSAAPPRSHALTTCTRRGCRSRARRNCRRRSSSTRYAPAPTACSSRAAARATARSASATFGPPDGSPAFTSRDFAKSFRANVWRSRGSATTLAHSTMRSHDSDRRSCARRDPPQARPNAPRFFMPTLAEAGGAARLPVDVAFERFALALPRDARARLACGWFALCVCALAAAGVLAVLLVLSRTPGLARLFPVANFFHVALVAHVDLSVLVWFLSFAGGLWSLNSTRRAMPLAWIALALAAIGALVIAGSPFAGGTPIMSNYVPVIDGPVFMTGLLIFGAGVALLVARGLFNSPLVGIRLGGTGALRFGLNSSLVAAAVAALAFAWSFVALPAGLDDKAHYELLFWGGGHVLQFAYTLMMLVAWLVLAEAIGARVPLSPRVVTLLFAIGLVAVFATPLIYFAYGITAIERRARAPQRQDSNATRPLLAALVASLVLFGVGGVIGFAIHGSDVRIPAHYHGSIVAVTIALMGLAYWLLPRFGFAAPPPRLATWQAYLYGSGQLLHMVGLVWSGGYGVQRKVADGALVERSLEQVAGMALMGAGGLIAIAGGMLFVAAVIIAVVRRPRPSAR